jgi:predicted amidophosphoribosyltransferase
MKDSLYCKSCFKEITLGPLRSLVEREPILCDDCISKIDVKLVVKKIHGIRTICLSAYDGLMKRWLMNYKELGDIELAPCFLFLFRPLFQMLSWRSLIVPLPSVTKREEDRGFSHLPTMLAAAGISFVPALRKSSETEQKTLSGPNRFHGKSMTLTTESQKLVGKSILLFDDVVTTGATLKEASERLLILPVRKVTAVVLMDNYHPEERRIK